MDRLGALQCAGVSIWLDTLSRDLLDRGEFAALAFIGERVEELAPTTATTGRATR